MTYDQTVLTETIILKPENDANDLLYYIDLIRYGEEDKFHVSCSWNDDFEFVFWAYGITSYEIVKYFIMDAVLSCDNKEEITDALTEIFMNECSDILVQCDGDCENCELDDDCV